MDVLWVSIRAEQFEKGSIIGRMVRLKNERVDLYGFATGGFGCKVGLGNAIFVDYIGNSFRDSMNRKELGIHNTERWERYFQGLMVADDPKICLDMKEDDE